MTYKIDPKTRRIIISDLTPSVKGEIITLQEYASLSEERFREQIVLLWEMLIELKQIKLHLASISGQNISEKDVE